MTMVQNAVVEHRLVKFEKAHDEQHAKSLDAIKARQKDASSRVRQRLIRRRTLKAHGGEKKESVKNIFDDDAAVREYECGLVSTDVALLGRPCIGIAPHEFPSVVRLTYAVAPGATSCVKASDELSNDWHAIPKEEDGTGQGRHSPHAYKCTRAGDE